jgi:hypothetical protein
MAAVAPWVAWVMARSHGFAMAVMSKGFLAEAEVIAVDCEKGKPSPSRFLGFFYSCQDNSGTVRKNFSPEERGHDGTSGQK